MTNPIMEIEFYNDERKGENIWTVKEKINEFCKTKM